MLPGRATAKKRRDCSQTGNRAGAAPEPTAAVQLHKRRRKIDCHLRFNRLRSQRDRSAEGASAIARCRRKPDTLRARRHPAPGRIDRHHWGTKFVPLAIGTEWVLFLRWGDYGNSFHVDNGIVGAFQIDGERMRPAGDDPWATYWRGRTIESFMDAMRQFVTQHRDEPRRGR